MKYEMKDQSRVIPLFDEEKLVEYYLDLNYYWWTDPENSLFGKRQLSKDVLFYWLKKGDEPPGLHKDMIYVVNNFVNDYMPLFRSV